VLLFVVLAVPMVAMVLYTFRDIPLEPSQRFWVVASTALVALISAWVIARL